MTTHTQTLVKDIPLLPTDIDLSAYTSRDDAVTLRLSANHLHRVACLEIQQTTRSWLRRQMQLLTDHAERLDSLPTDAELVMVEWERLTDGQRAVTSWNQLCARLGYDTQKACKLRSNHWQTIEAAGWVAVWDGRNTGMSGTGYRLERLDRGAVDETSA